MGVEHCALVKAWLSFYHEHKEAFRYGQTGPVQNVNLYLANKVERWARRTALFWMRLETRREAWLRSAGVGSSAYENQGSEGI